MAATQAGRPLRVTTPLGGDVLLLDGYSGEEGISMPFEYDVRMLSENDSISPTDLLRKPITITVDLVSGSGSRYINGFVKRLVQTGRRQTYTCYNATIVPWLWLLNLDRDCKIFQRMSVPDIIEKIFKNGGYTDYKLKLYKSYPKRDYCVQYRETSFNFVSRLMEDEGIFYFFEHTDSKHTMILTDSSPGISACAGQSTFGVAPDITHVQFEDKITQFDNEQRVGTGKVTLTDYNFETPSTDLKLSVPGVKETKNENYDYPGGYMDRGEADRYTKIRIEEQETTLVEAHGMGNCRAMIAGYKFTLKDHYRKDLNMMYLLTWLRSSMDSNSYGAAGGDSTADYSNQFVAIPFATPFRPERKAMRPFVHGPQTAVVVGPSGEEIYTDKYGRVKVQFFWDRDGKKNEDSSCWIRVSSEWAGKNWGYIAIPRMGQEVIISFLEGDPDRPLVTGRVYNAEQTVPYALPSNMTQTGIKTRSSKGGGSDNFNEMRFEDKKGSELIFVHAEKDLTTEVENDEIRKVDHDRTTTIKNDETKTVTMGNEKTEISKGNQTLDIKMGNQTNTIDMGNQSTTLKMGNQTTKMSLGKAEHEAMQSIELKVGQSSVKLDQMGVTIKGMMIKIEGQIQVQVKGLMTQVNGDAMLILKGGITMIN